MPQITFLALLAALIAFLVTNPTRATTPDEQPAEDNVAGDTKAPPMNMDDAKLISEKTRLIKQENERRKQIMDDAGG
jgi:hypothetical protein